MTIRCPRCKSLQDNRRESCIQCELSFNGLFPMREADTAELARQAEEQHQAGLAYQAELVHQAELAHQAELTRQVELAHQAELTRQAELAHQAELTRAPVKGRKPGSVPKPNRLPWLLGVALLVLLVVVLRPHGHHLTPTPAPTPAPTLAPTPPPAAVQFTTGAEGDGHTVYNYGLVILSESRPFTFFSPKTNKNETWTPEIRAGRLAYRLNDNLGDVKGMIGQGVSTEDAVKNVLQGTLSGDPVIYFKYGKADGDKMGDLILTVDAQTAADCGSPDPVRLSCWWRDMVRDYLLINLGRPPIYPLDAAGNPNPPAPLQDLFARLQKAVGQGPPDSTAFHAVYNDLLLPANQKSYNDLQTLYKTLPPDYVAAPDPIVPLNLRREDDMH